MKNATFRVLLIDDNEQTYHLIHNLLSQIKLAQFELDWVATQETVYEAKLLQRHFEGATKDYDVYLIDAQWLIEHTPQQSDKLDNCHGLCSSPFRTASEEIAHPKSDRNGLNLLPAIVEQLNPAPVVLLTDTPDLGGAALQAGAADYLEKSQLSSPLLERSLRLTIAHARTQVALKENVETQQSQFTRYRTLLEADMSLAEATLKESDQTFHSLVETLNAGLCVLDENGIITYVSNQICHLLEYEQEALLNHPLPSFVDEADQDILQQLSQAVKGERGQYEIAWMRRTGTPVYTIMSAVPLFDAQNRCRGSFAVLTDISDRIAIEAALKESEARYRVLAENSMDLISRHTPEGIYLYASPACRCLLGYEPDELVGHTAYEFFHPDYIPAIQKSHTTILNQPANDVVSYRIRHKQGHYIWFESTGRSVIDPDTGVIQEVIVVSRDITERKQAEAEIILLNAQLEQRVLERTAELQRANEELVGEIQERQRVEEALYRREQEFRALVENSPNIITRFDRQQHHVYVNPVIEQATGIPASTFIGKTNQELGMPEELVSHWNRAIQKVFHTAKEELIEFDFPTPAGLRRYQCHLLPEYARDGSVEFVLSVTHDITVQKKTQEQLQYWLVLETALAEVSRELASNDEADLNQVLRILGIAVGANRAYLIQFRGDGVLAELTHEWCDHKSQSQIEQFQNVETSRLPWWIEALKQNQNLLVIDVEALPAAAQAEKEQLKALNICSLAAVPIYTQSGELWGSIGFDNTEGNYKNWSDEDAQMLRVVGDMLYSYCARRQVQEELRASEALYSGIFNHSAESIFLVKVLPDGQFVYETLNPTHEKATGIAVTELAGKTPREVMSLEMATHVEQRYHACIAAGEPITYEETLELPNGTRMWQTSLVPIQDATGRIVKLQGSARDITEEKQAIAKQLRQTQYQHLLTTLTLKIRQSLQIDEILQTTVSELQKTLGCDRVLFFRLLSTDSGKVVNEAVIPGWSTLLGQVFQDECFPRAFLNKYQKGKIYACADVSSVGFSPCYREFLQQHQIRSILTVPILISHQGVGVRQAELIHSSDEELQANVWGLLFVHQCGEIREWKSFEIELLQQLANQLSIALYQAQLLEQETRQRQELARSNAELEQFAYVASHDLQEPLRTLASYAKLLERRYKGQLDARADRFIHYIVDGAARMQTLINDLLQYSRLGRSQKPFEATDCNLVFEQAIANLQQTICNNQAVVTCCELPVVIADTAQLVQLLQNLISNAIKYRREDTPTVHISAQRQENAWLFSVSDNGIGIACKYHERIFQIFQRLHTQEDYSGTGIGLAICQKIVERHGGCIWLNSQLGQGSTFYFTLPDITC